MKKMQIMLVIAVVALVLAGCDNMRTQPYLDEPFQPDPVFGTAWRDIDPNTVPVDWEGSDELFTFGTIDGQLADQFPFEITRDVIESGGDSFGHFCKPCHGVAGYGNGVISREGFPPPASFHDPEVRDQPVGHYYNVITNGQGAMYNYAARIRPAERWAIVAYIRALQFSQYAPYDDLPEDLQAQLDELNAVGG